MIIQAEEEEGEEEEVVERTRPVRVGRPSHHHAGGRGKVKGSVPPAGNSSKTMLCSTLITHPSVLQNADTAAEPGLTPSPASP